MWGISMYRLIDFLDWIVAEDTPYGSGASEKNWIVNLESKEKGIFKFPKTKTDNTITGEYWAEKMAAEIANVIGLESAKVDIGIFQNRKGSMSYMILSENEELIEGIHYITKIYPNYDGDRFEDTQSGDMYSIQMIMLSLDHYEELKRQFIRIPIFDCLIGNSDRHHNNWAVIKNVKTGELRISPVYDNGSSLCCYINLDSVDSFLNDRQRFESLIYGKSKSLIGWNQVYRPRHFDLLRNIVEHYYKESSEFIREIENKLTDEKIDELVYSFDDEIMEPKMKDLVIVYLRERRNRIINIYNQRKEANYE